MEIIQFFINLLSDPRGAIAGWITDLGPIWVYAPLFVIVFVETGLVVMPFLPGDSLLFTAGFFAHGGGLSLAILLPIVWIAAIAGDSCNYWIGREFGKHILESGKVKAMTPERVEKTEALINKWGSFAVFLGRFFPFIRTFVPFFAGLGHMHYPRFFAFNVLGALVWGTLFTLLGYFFGGVPVVQEHFELVIVAIVVISVIPAVGGAVKAKLSSGKQDAVDVDGDAADAVSPLDGAAAADRGATVAAGKAARGKHARIDADA